MTLLQIQEPEAPSSQEPKIAIGIDLGTTNSLAAIVQDGKPHILKMANGKTLIPSVIAYTPNPIVGDQVWSFLQKNPGCVISSIKRFMGKAFGQISSASMDLDTTPDGALAVRIDDVLRTPTEISADILKYLKKQAEQSLGMPIENAVITVPAYFSEAARTATRDAAQLAGLEVLRLVNEPTAAAIAYGLDQGEEGIYAVYDLGGGTFDISVLRLSQGVFQVLATGGDTHLGGDDMDVAIVKHFWNLAELPANDFKTALLQAKELKEQLTFQAEVSGKILTRDVVFAVQEFNAWIEPLIHRTLQISQQALLDAGLSREEYKTLKGIVLVGGATRIPYLQEKLANFFNQQPRCHLNPDEVVALGAAIQADALMGNAKHLLLDVTPLSLGIETMGGMVEKIIHRNTPLPCQAVQEFATYQDGQTAMTIHIVQGEREMVADCTSLAKFTLKGIPPMPAGKAHVHIKFQLDSDGLLSVSATEATTGISQTIEVKPSYGLSKDKVLQLLSDSYDHAAKDLQEKSLAALRLDVDRLGRLVYKILEEDVHLWNESDHQELNKSIHDIRSAIQHASKVVLEQYYQKLHQFLNQMIQHRLKKKLGS